MRASFPRFLVAAALALALLVLGGLGWAALAPVRAGPHEAVYEIPRGTSARRMAGEKVDIFPQTIRLTLGLDDVLVLKNADTVPHVFGPALILPGQSFRLPFSTASTYSFMCTAHPNGGLSVIVQEGPAAGWERLRWRWGRLIWAGLTGKAPRPLQGERGWGEGGVSRRRSCSAAPLSLAASRLSLSP